MTPPDDIEVEQVLADAVLVVADLERRGYDRCGPLRQLLRVVATSPSRSAGSCRRCGDVIVPAGPLGRPRRYCVTCHPPRAGYKAPT